MSSDITKCSGQGCPVKESCYRFTSIADEFAQSYFAVVPGKWEDDILNKKVWECEMYWGSRNQQILNHLKQIMK